MFVDKKKHDKVLQELKAIQDQRTAFLEALGLETDTKNDAVLTALQNIMEAKVDADADLQTANNAKEKAENDLKTANTAKETAEGSLNEVTTALDELGEDVKKAEGHTAKVEAVRTILAEKPGKSNSAGTSKKDKIDTPVDGVDQEAIDNLPHNKEVDRSMN